MKNVKVALIQRIAIFVQYKAAKHVIVIVIKFVRNAMIIDT